MIFGCGVSLTIKGQRLGVGSWDVLHVGLLLLSVAVHIFLRR